MEFTVKVRGVQTLEYKFHVHAQFHNANTGPTDSRYGEEMAISAQFMNIPGGYPGELPK